MTSYGAIFALALAAGFAMTLLVRWGARRLGIVDRPDGFRKVQTGATPLLGGVAIFAAFFLALVAGCWVTQHRALEAHMVGRDFLALLGGATVILLIGVWDDVRGLRVRWKLLGMGLVAVAMYVSGYRIGGVSNPFGASVHLAVLALPLTVFWFLGCMNAINLIDGLDGLAAGVTVFAGATIFLVGMVFGNTSAAALAMALAGATLGFLLLNFHPASIYLGDSGSLLLGFLLASIGLRGSQKSTTVVALLIPVIALGLPVMDTALAIVRRWTKALSFTAGDRQHIHHKLLEMGLSHRVTVLVMYGGCLMLGTLALLMTAANKAQAAVLLAALGLVTFLAVRVIGRHEIKLLKRRVGGYVERRNRRIRCRAAGYVASASMRHAETVDELWRIFGRVAQKMELDEAELAVSGPDGPDARPEKRRRWSGNGNGGDGRDDDALWSAAFPLRTNGVCVGKLSARKATNGAPLGPEIPDTLQLLSTALAINLARVQAVAVRPL